MDSCNSLVKVLDLVESRKSDMLTVEQLAKEAYLSASHLQRLFRLTTGQPLMDYVRGRKLAHSLEELFRDDMKVIDIAMNCGFQHEQSYIRAFCKEYNCTPGKARKDKKILAIRKRIAQEDLRTVEQGVVYGPEIVWIPMLNLIGKPCEFRPFDEEMQAWEPNRLGREFYIEALNRISNAICPEVYYAYTSNLPGGVEVGIEYMPCLQVRDLNSIPDGYTGRVIPAMQCARFRYVGQHSIEEISMATAREIYNARQDFFKTQTRYVQRGNIRHFERIDTHLYEGGFCQMELMPPVVDTLAE